MQRFLELCNLSHAADLPDETFALHASGGGRENPIVYQSPSWGGSLFERISLLWRYGPFALLKLANFIGNLLDNFGQIYPRLAAGVGYATVVDLLAAMSPVKRLKKGDDDIVQADDDSVNIPEMVELTQVDLATKLQSLGIGEQLLAELVMVASKVNYGQLASQLHSLVGSVSLAGIQVQKKVECCGSGFSESGYGSGSSLSSESGSGYGSRVLMTKN
jgi:hypothetical protein